MLGDSDILSDDTDGIDNAAAQNGRLAQDLCPGGADKHDS